MVRARHMSNSQTRRQRAAIALIAAILLGALACGRVAGAVAAPVTQPVAQAVSYVAQVAVDPDRHWLEATTAVALTINRATAELALHLNPALAVQGLSVDGKAGKFARDGDWVKIGLPRRAEAGDIVRVTMTYAGGIVSQGWGLRGHIGSEGIFVSREAWLPCDEQWSGNLPAELTVDLPAGHTLVNLGQLTASDAAGGRQRLHLMTNDLNLVAGVYDHRRVDAGATRVDLYTYAACPALGRLLGDEIPRAFEFLRRTLGPADIPSLVVVNMPAVPGFGGGVAYETVIGLVPDFRNARGYDIYSVLPHELVHRWQYARQSRFDGPGSLWLTEGAATYIGWLYLADRFGDDRFRDTLSEAAEVYWRDRLIDGRGSVVDWETNPRADLRYGTVYLKGAWVFHRFRETVGEQAFARFLREYLDWRPRHLDEFIAMCGRLAGTDLSTELNGWLRADESQSLTVVGLGGEPNADGYRPGLTATGGDLAVTVDGGRRVLAGTAVLRLRNELGRRPAFRLTLNTGLTVTSVLVRGQAAEFVQSTRDVMIEPPGGLAPGEAFAVELSYEGWPVAVGAEPLPATGALPASALWYPSLTDLTWSGTATVTVRGWASPRAPSGWRRQGSGEEFELIRASEAAAPISIAPAASPVAGRTILLVIAAVATVVLTVEVAKVFLRRARR